MTKRLLLVRHAVVDFTKRDRFTVSPRGRQWDPPLGEVGREQAERLAARLRLMDAPGVLVSSPFTRCRQTIASYTESAGIAVEDDPDLGEVFVGDWEGLDFEEIVSRDEELARRFREQEAMFALAPGGETGPQLRERVVPAVERAVARASDGATVVVVTHGGVINAYLADILGIRHDMFFLPDNASLNSVRADGDRRLVHFLNDVRHLTDPALFVPPPDPRSVPRDEGP